MSASWIPHEARVRLAQYQANKMSKEGELIVTAQEHRYYIYRIRSESTKGNNVFCAIRTQAQNKEECIKKLQEMVAEALITPKEREIWIGVSEDNHRERLKEKKMRSEVKKNRRKGGWDDF